MLRGAWFKINYSASERDCPWTNMCFYYLNIKISLGWVIEIKSDNSYCKKKLISWLEIEDVRGGFIKIFSGGGPVDDGSIDGLDCFVSE